MFSVSGVFYFYAAFAFVGGILISTTMHETKGKTDAEIDQLYGGKPLTPDEKSLPLTKGSYDNNYWELCLRGLVQVILYKKVISKSVFCLGCNCIIIE